ncbi:unnamed protein product [Trichogramma brassicae]|uniref:Uncharacterized protein n=1 Tax=Trichogramma brassicae TaxID=86971 RepID=A0A6H5IPQ3_9HYME|nr:unnamed protein product [Trichogramma brassicae]
MALGWGTQRGHPLLPSISHHQRCFAGLSQKWLPSHRSAHRDRRNQAVRTTPTPGALLQGAPHRSRLLRGHTLLASPPELDIFFRTRCLVPSCECGSRFCRRWQVPNLLCRLHLVSVVLASGATLFYLRQFGHAFSQNFFKYTNIFFVNAKKLSQTRFSSLLEIYLRATRAWNYYDKCTLTINRQNNAIKTTIERGRTTEPPTDQQSCTTCHDHLGLDWHSFMHVISSSSTAPPPLPTKTTARCSSSNSCKLRDMDSYAYVSTSLSFFRPEVTVDIPMRHLHVARMKNKKIYRATRYY